MKEKEAIEQKMISLLMGELDQEEAVSLKEEINGDKELMTLFDTYEKLFYGVAREPLHEVPSMVEARFDDWLKEETWAETGNAGRQRFTMVRLMKYAVAATVLLALGFFAGTKLMNPSPTSGLVMEEQEQAEASLHWVNTNSATTRIKGIIEAQSLIEVDPQVRDALIKIMQEDESANVRMAAVEALGRFVQDQVIKAALIETLDHEEEPIVQIAIIGIMVRSGETGAKESLESLIDKESIQPFVKDEARLGITRL